MVVSEFVQSDLSGNPFFRYACSLGEVIATPDNSTLYSHGFEYAGVDHLYTTLREQMESTSGSFLFRIAFEEQADAYDRLVNELRASEYPEIYSDTPDEHDLRVFNNFIDLSVPKIKNKHIKKWMEDV